ISETLLHAILTLHEKIRTGEITKRRNETKAGAQLQLDEPKLRPNPIHVRGSAKKKVLGV
ncbi:MAG: hypothetical protein M1288_02650, partial [Actinobacteria bacterium]|nr:hypothetical protein [Actinomycetota bacterium]